MKISGGKRRRGEVGDGGWGVSLILKGFGR